MSSARLKNAMPSPVICITPFNARTSENSAAILSALPPVACMMSFNMPPNPCALREDALKSSPSALAASAASLDGETIDVMTPLTAVIASDVSMPLAVNVEIAADNCSNETPKLAAMPTTLPMDWPRSSIVCLPISVEVKNTSFKCPTSSILYP